MRGNQGVVIAETGFNGILIHTSIGQNPFTETIYFRKYSVTRGFWAKIPVYESCAVGALLGDFGQLRAILGFSGLFLHKYAV